MLLAFYPAVSGAAFGRARAERPDYFAGGVIFGSKGDKLRLPDGREFDCIAAAGGPAAGRRWQCALIDPTAPAVDDPFALEDGPLAFVDELAPIFPGGDPSFEALVADHLGAFGGDDDRLSQGAQDVITFPGAGDLEDSYARHIEPALDNHANIRAALDADDPSDVIDATNAHDPEIDSARDEYVEDPPPDTSEPDPGRPPKGDAPEPDPNQPPRI